MQNAHHATVYEGEREAGLARARVYVESEVGVKFEANPDITIHLSEQYTVDDARTLKERAYQSPLGSAQVFVLAFDRITREAQNALLKLLEEPAERTHFILLVPSVEILLPTVRSRLAYGGRVVGSLSEADMAELFLASSPSERIKLVEPMYKNVKDDMKLVVRTRAVHFLDALEDRLHKHGVRKNASALNEIAFVRRYIGDSGSSLKMLLEHVALTV